MNFAKQTTESPYERHLLMVVDAGLAGVMFVAPLFMGGRHPLGQLVLVAIVGATASAWFLRQSIAKQGRWTWSGAELVLLAGLAILGLQLIPFPESVLSKLSPSISQILPLWTTSSAGSVPWGSWKTLSLTPDATVGSASMFAAYVLLFLVVVQRVRSVADIHVLLKCLALASIGMAALGLAQFLLGNGKYLWLYEHPYRDALSPVKGVFINQNHFAHFLALGIGPVIWWMQSLYHEKRSAPRRNGGFGLAPDNETIRHALVIGAGLLAFAGLLTFSRGGVIAIGVATLSAMAAYFGLGLAGKKGLLTLAGLGAILFAALLLHGYEPLARRLVTFNQASSLEELSRGRKILWEAHLDAIPKFSLTGMGIGSHREAYKVFVRKHVPFEYSHGESGYMHLLLEGGVPALLLLLAGISLSLWWCVRTLLYAPDVQLRACAAALLAGLLASCVHSIADFVWYIPACMSLTVITVACACKLFQLSNFSRFNFSRAFLLPRWSWGVVSLATICASGLMLQNRIGPALASPHWDKLQKLAVETETAGASEQDQQQHLEAMAESLVQLLRHDPGDARAHLMMAEVCRRQFDLKQRTAENPMSVKDICDAAIASQFPTMEAQDRWLNVAVGANRAFLDSAQFHATRAVRLCPLQGEAYVYLAELVFLEQPPHPAKPEYLSQAQLVRPLSGPVLLSLGTEAALAGDLDRALELWKQVFDQDPALQSRIIELLVPQMPAEALIGYFKPRRAAQGKLFQQYRKLSRFEDACFAGESYLQLILAEAQQQQGEPAGKLWDEARKIKTYMKDEPGSLHCATKAVEATPNHYGRRQVLALALLNSQQYAEAIEQLKWCLHRTPGDSNLRASLLTAQRQKLDAATTELR